MQAVILVGGEGTRLRPLTYGTPKPMVPVFGVPFLERTLSRLKEAGVDDVVLAAGYLPRAIVEHLGDGSRLGMRLEYVVEKAPLGTAGAIRNVAQYLHGPFFVLNGDVLTSLDLRAMMEYHRRKGGLGCMHLIRVEDPSPFGCVVHDGDGRIARFVEKPPPGTAETDEINAGTYLLEPAVLDAIPPGRNVSIERETFPNMLAQGAPLYSYTTADYWLDIGRPEQYLQAHFDVLDRRLALGPLADPAAHRGTFVWGPSDEGKATGHVVAPSYVGANVTIEPGAELGPYAVLGDGTRVARGARIRNAVLWSRVEVGADARIDHAILADDVKIGRSVLVGPGSVIGHAEPIGDYGVVAPQSRIPAEPASVR